MALQVTHSPATHVLMCEGRRWRFLAYDEADLQFSLQGHIRIRPVGIMSITFDDGDVYEWTAVISPLNQPFTFLLHPFNAVLRVVESMLASVQF